MSLLAACTSKNIPVKENNQTYEAHLAQGAAIFTESCQNCHELPKPNEHNEQQWSKIMDRMAPKAKLTDEQKQLVFQYVISERK